MDRVEFMRQLECLLWDVPENDRLDAIAYYNNYFDEAGKENEMRVIQELGSPEKVAKIIKADLNATGNERAEYTEYGYSDGRSGVNPNTPIRREPGDQESKRNRKIPLALIIVLLVFAAPMILGVGTGVLGGLIGLIAGAFGILIAIVACGVAFPIAGIACFVTGIVGAVSNPLEGLMIMGVGALLTAVGLFLVVLCAWTAFKWLPALFKICVNGCQRIFGIGKRREEA